MPRYVVLWFLLGCSGPMELADASPDPGARDAGPLDAGADAAAAAEDAGPPPPPPLPLACDDAVGDVYLTPSDLPPGTAADRGALVRCAREGWLSPSELASRLARGGVQGIVPRTGAHVYRIAYRTTRRDPGGESPALGTAWALIPDTRRDAPSPAAVVAHGTAGVADVCAPSRHPASGDSLVVPWAARGWPVIAPDYAGLGNDGIQGYGDNDDTARSVLDAARALARLAPEGTLSGRFVLSGHSQGGGAVLSSQALSGTYGAGLDLALVIPFAPGWPTGRDVNGYRFPALSTSFGGGAPAAIGAIFLYAWHARAYGDARAGEGFPSWSRDAIVAALGRDCIYELALSIPRAAPTFGDLVAPALRVGLVDCADGRECTGTARELWEFMGANILRGARTGPPILAFAGTADTLAPPAEIACIARHLEADGLRPRVCVDTSTHFDILGRNAAYAIDHAEAVLAGVEPPTCPTSVPLPPCGR